MIILFTLQSLFPVFHTNLAYRNEIYVKVILVTVKNMFEDQGGKYRLKNKELKSIHLLNEKTYLRSSLKGSTFAVLVLKASSNNVSSRGNIISGIS